MATKEELIKQFKQNTIKAHPLVKRMAYQGLMRLPKKELSRYAKYAHVVHGGDIDYTPRKQK